MTDVPYSIIDFFNTYPDAEEVHDVSTQLFHANAKEAAENRSKYYGVELKTYKREDVFGAEEPAEDLTLLAEALKNAAELEVLKAKAERQAGTLKNKFDTMKKGIKPSVKEDITEGVTTQNTELEK